MSDAALWMPKRKETDKQCAGCPFGTNNDKQFAQVLTALRKSAGGDEAGKFTKKEIARARNMVKEERDQWGGDFMCHGTVFGPGMKVNEKNGKQCPGASEYYRSAAGHPGDA